MIHAKTKTGERTLLGEPLRTPNARSTHESNVLRSQIIGESPPMKALFALVERVAPTRATILVTGETGTGKELVAQAIHELSGRRSKPFVPVNCSALPETLLESELFGHTRGSFTGASADHKGVFEQAIGGTLFLDEVSTISPAIQVKLLRVLQDRRIQRVGGSHPIDADFRLIAATNQDLAAEVRAGRFREDLYYRLQVFPIHVPPLRQRRGDVRLLVEHFRAKSADENDVVAPAVGPEIIARLDHYEWPGNVRELQNYVARAIIMYAGREQIAFDPPPGEHAQAERELIHSARRENWTLDRLEREYILDTVERCAGRRVLAAQELGIDRRTLHRKLKEYGLQAVGLNPP